MLTTAPMFNGTTATKRERYWTQWVTNQNQSDLQVIGYCVRDMDTFNGDTVFRHESKIVCEKIAGLLNEGSQ